MTGLNVNQDLDSGSEDTRCNEFLIKPFSKELAVDSTVTSQREEAAGRLGSF